MREIDEVESQSPSRSYKFLFIIAIYSLVVFIAY